MTLKIVRPTMKRSLIVALFLALLGFSGNYLNIPIAYSVSFIFGSIFSIIALLSLGIWFGIAVAFLSSIYTYFLWNHPYAIFIFTLEIIWIGIALKKGKKNIIMIDSVYWLALGLPLITIFYYGFMHLGAQSAAIIFLKQSLNGILNALIASIVITHTPVISLIRNQNIAKKSLYSLSIFHLVSTFLIIPAIALVLLQNYQIITSTQVRVVEDVSMGADEAELIVAEWVSRHVNAARIIAELGSKYPIAPSENLQSALQQIHALFPDFHNIFLGNASATTVAFHPDINEKGESTIGINFIDRQWFQQLSSTLQPVISDVFMGRGGIFQPIFSISVPVLVKGKLSHFGLGAINLEKMTGLFERKGEHKDLIYTIIDSHQNIVFSSDPSKRTLSQLETAVRVKHIPVFSNVFLRLPADQTNISIMGIWKDASYYTERSIQGTPWQLIVEYPVGPLQESLYDITIKSLGIIALIFAFMIVLANVLSNLLTRPLRSLSLLSKDIPQKIEKGEKLLWPQSEISEVSDLIDNFTITAHTLENRLLETRERYKALVENSPSGIWIADHHGNITYTSSNWNEITGIVQSNSVAKGWLDAVHPDDKAIVATKWTESIARTSNFQSEYRLQKADGEVKWVLAIASVINEHENLSDWIGTITDITIQKQTEENYRNLVQHSPDIFYKFSNKYGGLFWSERTKDILGIDPDEIKQDPMLWNRSIHPEYQNAVNKAIQNYYQGSDYSIEYKMQTKQGKWIWLHDCFINKTIIGDEIIVEGHAVDITRIKEADEALRKEQFRLAYIIEGTNVGTWEWNVQTGENIIDERWAKIIGYTLEELSPFSTETWMKLSHPNDLKISGELLEKHFNKDLAYYENEARMQHKNGSWIWVLDRGKVSTWSEDGKPLVMSGTHQDITERKQREERIINLLQEKELLLKEVHHRIRNNMSTIMGLLSLQSKTLNNAEAKMALKEAENRVQSMLVLYDKLFLSSDFQNVSSRQYFETLIDEIIKNFPNKDIVSVTYEINDVMLGAKIIFDLGIIINELITNTMKHAFVGKESGKINASLVVDEGRAIMTIQDDGIELPESVSFENPAARFGFKLVFMLVNQLDGSIEIEREEGTKFTIKFNIET